MPSPSALAKLRIAVLPERLDANDWLATMETDPDTGAVASFLGICRADGGTLQALELEHYPGMAEAEMSRIAEEARRRWPITSILAVHRTGMVNVGEPIVLVAATSSHRAAAFDAVRFVMDFLKTDAPFWKREHLANGTVGEWVEANTKDDAARDRWTADGG
ncbi:MAG: molybdenum cofactor biosynthesis protein MoaE [Pseudomonadota bacterium]